MYAIIATGGKQYKVSEGDTLRVELLKEEAGKEIELEVLALVDDGDVKAGEAVKDAAVTAKVVGSGKGKKINIFTYKAKKNVRKRQGHRQPYTELEIVKIKA